MTTRFEKFSTGTLVSLVALTAGCTQSLKDTFLDLAASIAAANALTEGITFPQDEAEVIEGEPPEATPGTSIALVGEESSMPVFIGPGSEGVISFDFSGLPGGSTSTGTTGTAGSGDRYVIVYFDPSDSYIRIKLRPDGSVGKVQVPYLVREDVCDNVDQIIHNIQCNETLQALSGGDVAAYLIQRLEFGCDRAGNTETTRPVDTDPPTTTDTGTGTGTGTGTTETGGPLCEGFDLRSFQSALNFECGEYGVTCKGCLYFEGSSVRSYSSNPYLYGWWDDSVTFTCSEGVLHDGEGSVIAKYDQESDSFDFYGFPIVNPVAYDTYSPSSRETCGQ